jgi:hypothetical protein
MTEGADVRIAGSRAEHYARSSLVTYHCRFNLRFRD